MTALRARGRGEWSCLGVAVLCLTLLPRPSRADDQQEARQHFAEAQRLAGINKPREAIEEYKKAEALAVVPATLYNIADLYDELAHKEHSSFDAKFAVDYYRRYVKLYHGRKGADPDDRVVVETRITNLCVEFDLSCGSVPPPLPPPPPPPPPPSRGSAGTAARGSAGDPVAGQ